MGHVDEAELGSSQRGGRGFPQLKGAPETYRLRRTALAAIAFVGFISAMAATSAAIEGHADAGVVIDSSDRVEAVSRTGFAWRDGIRPGQHVVSSSKSDAVDGWALETIGPSGKILSREAPVVEALQDSLSFALVGLAGGCLAIAFLHLNRAWVLPTASLALVGASAPLFLANQLLTGPVLGSAALVPGFGVAYRFRGNPAVGSAIALAVAGLTVAWANSYLNGAPTDSLEEARRAVSIGATGLLMADRAVRNRPMRVTSLQAVGLVLAAVLISVGLGLVYFSAFPAPLIAIAIVLALVAFQPLRSLLGRRLELALMADLRHHVAADVAEEERGRLARELHDAPLQELAAVSRPPAAVEFALYRIAREAVANALRHARASNVQIEGSIALDAVDLAVIDDGIGLLSGEWRRASGRGRLGLASMRRRAQGIGAELSIHGDRSGTRVSVSWRL
jgi:signal transduction histidine kinase